MSGRKVTFHWPSRPQKSKALHPGIFNNCFCGIEQPCPSLKGIRDGPTAASGSTARGSEAAAPGAPEFEF
jgi:hypothetical protein